MTFIYALIDPRTAEVRYVGKANDPVTRLMKHVRLDEGDHTHRACWLRQLLAEGLKPDLRILEQVCDEAWQEAERRWIACLREAGADLTNATDGGDGVSGWKPSAEHVARNRANGFRKKGHGAAVAAGLKRLPRASCIVCRYDVPVHRLSRHFESTHHKRKASSEECFLAATVA